MKWLNTLPSQGNIHGFEFRTGYQICNNRFLGVDFLIRGGNNVKEEIKKIISEKLDETTPSIEEIYERRKISQLTYLL